MPSNKNSAFLQKLKKLNKEYQNNNSNQNKNKKAPKEAGSVLYKYASTIVNNRVLDLYLKALGIATLTPTTLVPLALLMGATTFSETVESILGLEKRAGSTKKTSSKKSEHSKDDMYIPILDDSVFGTYTKYAGATVQLALSPFTLVPIGLAVALYEFFNMGGKEQTGGGSAWVISQNSGGPVNSANIWANHLSSKFSAFGREMTPVETQAITGYPFQQQPNTLLTIAPQPEALDGLGAGSYAGAAGGNRKSQNKKRKSQSQKRRSRQRRSSSRSRVNQMYRKNHRRSQQKSQ